MSLKNEIRSQDSRLNAHFFLQVNELVQVETYLRSEGVLVRYWYPIDMLERPPAGYRRTATNGLVTLDNTNLQIHR
jgi:E3 ubiquitin-protein ligase HECTD4